MTDYEFAPWTIKFRYFDQKNCLVIIAYIAWKVSKYGVISGLYFPVFSPNTGKYGPEITPYLDTFHAALCLQWICQAKFFIYLFEAFAVVL